MERYKVDMTIKWSTYVTVGTKQEAIDEAKDTFFDEYGIKVSDSEIDSVIKLTN